MAGEQAAGLPFPLFANPSGVHTLSSAEPRPAIPASKTARARMVVRSPTMLQLPGIWSALENCLCQSTRQTAGRPVFLGAL